ncbi:cupin [Rhodoferax antarcticus]|nr:cupin [Rhodoferax antarcticus]
MSNLFADATPPEQGERFETLLNQRGVVIERIVSSSRIARERYVQAQDEWVVLLQGEATLDVDGRAIALTSGGYLFLPAETPHMVLSVTEGALWLAIHLYPSPSADS